MNASDKLHPRSTAVFNAQKEAPQHAWFDDNFARLFRLLGRRPKTSVDHFPALSIFQMENRSRFVPAETSRQPSFDRRVVHRSPGIQQYATGRGGGVSF